MKLIVVKIVVAVAVALWAESGYNSVVAVPKAVVLVNKEVA